jgi:hypothetical protein
MFFTIHTIFYDGNPFAYDDRERTLIANYLTAFKTKLQSLVMEILHINHFCNTVFCNIGASIIFSKMFIIDLL